METTFYNTASVLFTDLGWVQQRSPSPEGHDLDFECRVQGMSSCVDDSAQTRTELVKCGCKSSKGCDVILLNTSFRLRTIFALLFFAM